MATLEFGNNNLKTVDQYIEEIYEIVGDNFPLKIVVVDGVLKSASIETTWKEGGTISIESVDEEGNTVIDYEENYVEKELTESQIADLNSYLQENLVP